MNADRRRYICVHLCSSVVNASEERSRKSALSGRNDGRGRNSRFPSPRVSTADGLCLPIAIAIIPAIPDRPGRGCVPAVGGEADMATILVCADRLADREFMVKLLGGRGHRMIGAVDGPEALGLVVAERPGLIIIDVQMPRMEHHEFV